MNKKMNLQSLEVKSFITNQPNSQALKGGGGSGPTCNQCLSGSINFCIYESDAYC